MRNVLTLLNLDAAELGPRKGDFMLTRLRFAALAASLCWMGGALLYAQRIITVEPAHTVTESRVNDVERRLDILDSIKVGERLSRIEALMEAEARSSEANRTTTLAIAVPVALLALEGLFRLAAAAMSKARR